MAERKRKKSERKRRQKAERARDVDRDRDPDWDRGTEWDHEASERVIRQSLRPGYGNHHWSSQGELSGLGNLGPPYAPDWSHEYDYEGKPLIRRHNDWRSSFQGGFGNTGTMGEAAYNLASADALEHRPGSGLARYHGPPRSPIQPDTGDPHEGSWAQRGFGPRGYAGGFIGHEYDWTRRAERTAVQPFGNARDESHAGHGPRGYTRSDDRIYEEVCDRLTEHTDIDARTIEVRCQQGEVTLEGTIPDRRSKRLAEAIAESAPGVRDVHNRLRIGSTPSNG